MEEHFGDKLRVEYRLFPLSFHEHGESDAVAALAAHKQGKFYEFVTKLYSDVRNQDDATMQRYAKELGLDLATFNADRKDPELLRYARMEQKAGERVGVRGTPTMFLNGHKLEARDLAAMTTAVDAELAAVDALVKDGKTVAQARTARVLAADNGQVFYDSVVNRQPIAVDLTPKAAPKPKAKPKAEPVDKTVFNAEIFPGDPMEGPADALVTVVECTDFQ